MAFVTEMLNDQIFPCNIYVVLPCANLTDTFFLPLLLIIYLKIDIEFFSFSSVFNKSFEGCKIAMEAFLNL